MSAQLTSSFAGPDRWSRSVIWLGASILVAVSVVGLLYRWALIWLLCPQSLVVMFWRQAQRPYDSLGAAGYPDLAVAALYFPLMAWLLSRANRNGKMLHIARWIGIWHLVAVAIAIGMATFRNHVWSYSLDG